MEFIVNLLIMSVSVIFINNIILSKFLGLCPYMGVSKRLDAAFGMGMAVIFVMTMASAFTWVLDIYVLQKFNITFLQTIVFILTIATLVQFVEIVLQKTAPTLYNQLGVYLPLLTTNCAVLGVTILNIDQKYSFIESIFHAIFAGIGFTLVLIMMAGIRERLERAEVPPTMKGLPIALVTAGCMALAFLGFSGMNLGG